MDTAAGLARTRAGAAGGAYRSLQIDALTWDRNGRDAAFLNHRGKRLAEATALAGIEGYRKRLSVLEFDYLAACRAAERLAQRRTRRIQTMFGVLAFGIVAALLGWLNESYLQERVNWFTTMRPYMLAQVRPYVLGLEAERALRPKDIFRECAKDCPEMIVVPAGEFTVGSPVTEAGHEDYEGPQHTVTIARPFAVSKFDVTFADWDACVAVGGCVSVSDSRQGRGTKPLINITWDDAQHYVEWFSRMTGQPYRRSRRPNGYTRLAQIPRRSITGATRLAGGTQTAGAAAASGTTARHRRSDRSSQMPSASTTWPETCGNGWRIAITTTTTERPQTVRRGPLEIVVSITFAA
jgi:hypothetical protein